MERVLSNDVLLQEILGKLTHPADLSAARGVSCSWKAACKDHQQIVCGNHFNLRPYDLFDSGDELISDTQILALCKELQRCRHTVRVLLVQLQLNSSSDEDRRLYGVISMLFGLQALSLLGDIDLERVQLGCLPNSLQQLELQVCNQAALPLAHLRALQTLLLYAFHDWDAADNIEVYMQLPTSVDRFGLSHAHVATRSRRFQGGKVTVLTTCTDGGIGTLEEYLKSVNPDMRIDVQVESPNTLPWIGLDKQTFAREMSYVSGEED